MALPGGGSAFDHDYNLKLLVLGGTEVGKTSIIKRFHENTFTDFGPTTMGVDFIPHRMEHKGKKLLLKCYDTAGQERFRTINHLFYRNTNAVMIVYNLVNKETTGEIEFYVNEVIRHGGGEVPFVIVGNKRDLVGERQVTTAEGQAFADKYKVPFFEVSAKTGEGVEEACLRLVDFALDTQLKILARSSDPPSGSFKIGRAPPAAKTDCKC